MDEQSFWRRMTPARLHALYAARFGPPAAQETAPPRSLSEYLMGG